MRGKLTHQQPYFLFPGLIPAYAGKTFAVALTRLAVSAHPRVCGENALKNFGTISAVGSSPRMRGKPRSRPVIQASRGLIPAYAGKTTVVEYAVLVYTAHPRVCGENG